MRKLIHHNGLVVNALVDDEKKNHERGERSVRIENRSKNMLATSAKPHQYRYDYRYLYHPDTTCFTSRIVALMKCSRIEVAINDIGIQSRVQYSTRNCAICEESCDFLLRIGVLTKVKELNEFIATKISQLTRS